MPIDPNKESPDPKRAAARRERLDPIVAKSKTLNDMPTFAKALTDIEEAARRKFITETWHPRPVRNFPWTLRPLPRRAAERTLRELPN
jgi:hypothetical protein